MKYELTNDSITSTNGITLFRIKALKDFSNVKLGELGGYIQSVDNLSQDDNARASGNALVYGNAKVYDNALVSLRHYVKYNVVKSDLSTNLIENIEAQTGLKVFNNEVYCYKHVRENLSSLHYPNFIYTVGEYVEAHNPDLSDSSCSSGLHVSSPHCWNFNGGKKVLFCKVSLNDIITVQQGKIRCKKLFVIGVCDGDVY